jgi:hypothetical protein
MLKLIDSNELWYLFNDDPVRPHLSANFRTSLGREAFALYNHKETDIRAVICCAYTNEVPITESELDYYSQAACADETVPPRIAVFYTVWSYDRGAGRDIVLAARDHARDVRGCTQFVTLSPLTEMAETFHLRNGAALLERGDTCQNFEYPATS